MIAAIACAPSRTSTHPTLDEHRLRPTLRSRRQQQGKRVLLDPPSSSFAGNSVMVIGIHPREVHRHEQVHHVQLVVIIFVFDIVVGVSTAVEVAVIEGASLEMVSM